MSTLNTLYRERVSVVMVVVLGILLCACDARRLAIYRPLLRYNLPENEGSRALSFDFQSNAGPMIVFDGNDLDSYHRDHFDAIPEFAFTYGPFDKVDFAANIGYGGFGAKAKYQVLGKDQVRAGAGDMSVALSGSVNYTEDYNGGDVYAKTGMGIAAYYTDVTLSVGYRPAPKQLVYSGVFYSEGNYRGRIEGTHFSFNEPCLGVNLGVATFLSTETSLILEAVDSRYQWRGKSWSQTAMGLRFEKDIHY